MITGFTVKNFKAIGEEPVRIELKPITLLFGANSAGKSSILHALNYAYSVFVDRNLNAEYNDHSDSNFNLGHFSRFIYSNNKSHSILLRFDLNFESKNDINDKILINFSDEGSDILQDREGSLYSIFKELDPREILNNIKTAYVEVEISWSSIWKEPYVSRYETGLDGERIATIYADDSSNKSMVRYFNESHKVYKKFAAENQFNLNWLVNYEFKSNPNDDNINIMLSEYQKDALPFFDVGLVNFKNIWCDDDLLTSRGFISHMHDYREYEHFKSIMVAFEDLLTSVLVSPGNKVANWLRNTLYLGPLREIPSRHFLGEISRKNSQRWRWEKGLGAWDFIYRIGKLQLSIGKLRLNQLKKPDKIISLHDPFYKVEIFDWLKENFENYKHEIWASIISDSSLKRDYDYYLFSHEFDNKIDDFSIKKDYIFYKLLTTNDLSNIIADLNIPITISSGEFANEIFNKINNWLAGDKRLNTGYEIFIERYRKISSDFFKDFEEEMSRENMLALFKEILNEPEDFHIWLNDISRSIYLKPHEIGTGISQILPVVVAAISASASLLMIEQPELHIHPAIQVQLGDLFIEQSNDQKFFLIETHSEHLLLRILRRIRETAEEKSSDEIKIRPEEVSIYYVESKNGKTQVNHIGLGENGRFTNRWPRGFFEEREKEYFGEQEDLSDELGRLFGE